MEVECGSSLRVMRRGWTVFYPHKEDARSCPRPTSADGYQKDMVSSLEIPQDHSHERQCLLVRHKSCRRPVREIARRAAEEMFVRWGRMPRFPA